MIRNESLPFITLTVVAVLIVAYFGIMPRTSAPQAVTISLDSGTQYQTINGWEAVAQAGQLECQGFSKYKNEVYDRAVNELGINRLRLEIKSGTENPVDYFSQYMNGQIDRSEWKTHWHDAVNDNGNPNAIDPNGFQFSWLDHTIDTVVLPVKQRVEARGENLYINLEVLAPDSPLLSDNPDEYAEFVLATFQHIDSKYGWVPDSVEIVNEPKYDKGWSPAKIGNNLVAVGDRLANNGYTPDFAAPSTVQVGEAINWFDDIIQMPGTSQYLSELAFHRYGGATQTNLGEIGDRTVQYGIRSAQLEKFDGGGTHEALYEDLTLARVSAWQQFTLAFCVDDNGAQYYWVNTDDPSNPVVHLGSRSKFLRQYFFFVRRGAVRIGASSSNGSFEPVGFINSNGTYVTVIKASQGGSFNVQGLPAGTYGINYTTDSAFDVDNPDVTINAGETVNTSIPAAGVLTVYGKSGSSTPTAPNSVSINGKTSGGTGIQYAFTANVSPSSATLPMTYTWQATGQSTVQRTAGLSDTVTFNWTISGTKVITTQAANAGGGVQNTHAITILAPESDEPPLDDVTLKGPDTGVPKRGLPFTATVAPVSVTTPITYVWDATDKRPITTTSGLTDNVTMTWNVSGTKRVTTTAIHAGDVATDTETVQLEAASPDNVGITDVTINGPTARHRNTSPTFTSAIEPADATEPVTYTWNAAKQAPVIEVGGVSDTVTFVWNAAGTYTINVTAENAVGSASDVHTITIRPSYKAYIPLVVR